MPDVIVNTSPNYSVTVSPQVVKVVEISTTPGDSDTSILEARLNETGAYLEGLITVSSAGVNTINSLSGVLFISGQGGTVVTNSGQNILISGGNSINTGLFYPINNPSGYITGEVVRPNQTGLSFITPLISGIDYQAIPFSSSLSNSPTSVTCEIENDIDNLIYSHVINSVTNTGFIIYFSDFLSASGYRLHTKVNI